MHDYWPHFVVSSPAREDGSGGNTALGHKGPCKNGRSCVLTQALRQCRMINPTPDSLHQARSEPQHQARSEPRALDLASRLRSGLTKLHQHGHPPVRNIFMDLVPCSSHLSGAVLVGTSPSPEGKPGHPRDSLAANWAYFLRLIKVLSLERDCIFIGTLIV